MSPEDGADRAEPIMDLERAKREIRTFLAEMDAQSRGYWNLADNDGVRLLRPCGEYFIRNAGDVLIERWGRYVEIPQSVREKLQAALVWACESCNVPADERLTSSLGVVYSNVLGILEAGMAERTALGSSPSLPVSSDVSEVPQGRSKARVALLGAAGFAAAVAVLVGGVAARDRVVAGGCGCSHLHIPPESSVPTAPADTEETDVDSPEAWMGSMPGDMDC